MLGLFALALTGDAKRTRHHHFTNKMHKRHGLSAQAAWDDKQVNDMSHIDNFRSHGKRGCDESNLGSGSTYRGCQTKTRRGYECQNWSLQTPHRHGNTPSSRRGSGLADGLGNFCRNPDGESTIWCYTTDRRVRWDYCNPLPASKMYQAGHFERIRYKECSCKHDLRYMAAHEQCSSTSFPTGLCSRDEAKVRLSCWTDDKCGGYQKMKRDGPTYCKCQKEKYTGKTMMRHGGTYVEMYSFVEA